MSFSFYSLIKPQYLKYDKFTSSNTVIEKVSHKLNMQVFIIRQEMRKLLKNGKCLIPQNSL